MPVLGNETAGSASAVTFSSLIEETIRRIQPAQMDLTCTLNEAIVNTVPGASVSFTVTGEMVQFISYGMVLAIDMENFYVTDHGVINSTVTAIAGYQGSIPTIHTAGTTVYINPKFTRFDVGSAINEELNDLSGATNGLFQVKTDDITFNPVFMGYDLPMDPGFIDVIGVRFKIAPPTHNYPTIKRWAVLPDMTDPVFPSGQALMIYEGGWPGLPLHVWYTAAFRSAGQPDGQCHHGCWCPTHGDRHHPRGRWHPATRTGRSSATSPRPSLMHVRLPKCPPAW